MRFDIWLEAKIGSTSVPLYHAHPNVDELKKVGFTQNNVDHIGSGIASTSFQGQRVHYGSGGGIHLSRSYDFCVRMASKMGPAGGVVQVFFNTRKPFYVPNETTQRGTTNFRVFINPEDKYLLPLTGNKKTDLDRIAQSILRMTTTKQVYDQHGDLGMYEIRNDAPLPLQAKALAREFLFGGKGFKRTGWPADFRNINPAFEEDLFADLGVFNWTDWAKKGYLDSVWWGTGSGPFHGEEEVTVYDPRRLKIGSIVHRNTEDAGPLRSRRHW